jgi:hypothetical protein
MKKPSMLSGVSNLNSTKRSLILYAIVFASFAGIRALAEFQAGELPAGWDSTNYYSPWTVAYMAQGIMNHHFMAAPPLVFVMTIPLTIITQNVWLTIKILAPLLYGVLGLSVVYFVRSYLSWDAKKSVICSLLLMSQIAALRISWDLFKNQLAISLLFFQLSLIFSASQKITRKTKLAILALSLLIVLAHQFVAAAYFAILLSIMLTRKRTASFKRFLLCANLPALAIFIGILGIYSGGLEASVLSYPGVNTIQFFKTIFHVDVPTFSVFKNYVAIYGSYSNLSTQIITLFFLLYAPLLSLVILGFWNDELLTPLSLFMVVGALLPLASPSFALLDFERWMWMLVYPFSIYASNALFRLLGSAQNKPKLGKLRIGAISYEKFAVTIYLLFLIVFALLYVNGSVRPIYTSIQGFVPTSLSDKPISNEGMKDIISNIEWLNELHHNKYTVNFVDQFESINSTTWIQAGDITLENSTLTMNTTEGSGTSYLQHDFGVNYVGTVELRFRFNKFTPESQFLDLLLVHKSNGYGGGVIYCSGTSNSVSLDYWDSETNSPYQLAQLDEEWHKIRMTCNTTGRVISVDDATDLLLVETGQLFGKISIGQTVNLTGYGGSLSVDYIIVEGKLSACAISSFREVGPLWIYLDKEIEIVAYVKNIDTALNFSENRSYTTVFALLPTSSYDGFTAVHEKPVYSIYVWGS